MLKRVLLLTLLCIIFTSLCCSCGLFGEQDYECDFDTIESIEIIKIGEFLKEKNTYEYTIVCTISDCSNFVDRLNAIEYSVNWGDPSVLENGDTVIKVVYMNGDYDLLCNNSQVFYRSGIFQSGYLFFDENQFNALIFDYLGE